MRSMRRRTQQPATRPTARQAAAFAVQVLFADEFGAGWKADALFAATAVPTFITMALFASLGRAAVPAFVQERETYGELSWRTVAGTVNASFVVLGASPLDDIRNTRSIERVYLRGTEVERDELRRSWVSGG